VNDVAVHRSSQASSAAQESRHIDIKSRMTTGATHIERICRRFLFNHYSSPLLASSNCYARMRNSRSQFRRTELMSNRLRTLGQDLVVITVYGVVGSLLFFSPWF
jgi:hypothetical protein